MAISTPHTSRRDFIRMSSTLGLAAGLAATLAACGGSSSSSAGSGSAPGANSGAAQEDGVITAGISYELGAKGYDPMTTSAALTIAANWHTMEGLTELDPATRECYPALAAEMPTMVSETSYEATLRDGAKFSDGTDVTVEDVVFSFERVLDPANTSLYAPFLAFLDKVEKKDDKTVSLTLKYPFSLVPERLSVVKVVPQALVEADPQAFDLNPMGTGPYTMTDNGAGSQQVAFERNDNYNGPKPALAKTMTWQILQDDTTRTNAITSGTVQAIDAVPATNLASMSAPLTVAAEQGFGLLFAMFNSKTLPDAKARQAILYALDYDKICNNGMSGLATPATCFVDDAHPAYRKAKNVYTYDVEKAKALIAEAGVTSIKVAASDHGWFSTVRPVIKENLEALGIAVNYSEVQSSTMYDELDNDPTGEKWDVVIAPGDPSVFGNDADLLMRWWYSADTWTEQREHWKGTEAYTAVQTALDEAVQLTGEEQIAAWQAIFDTLSEEVPLYPIFHRKSPTAYNSETLTDFKPITLTGLSFLGVGSTVA